MARVNDKMADAKKAKNDEFYTLYEDIQKEINAYLEYAPDVFRGKTVLLPCDDPEWSNFTRFFAQNFGPHPKKLKTHETQLHNNCCQKIRLKRDT